MGVAPEEQYAVEVVRRGRWRWRATVFLVRGRGRAATALAALPAPAAAGSLPSVSSGHRPGPDVLYTPAPRAPQLENTGPWSADPILISGASSYREGEFVYQ